MEELISRKIAFGYSTKHELEKLKLNYLVQGYIFVLTSIFVGNLYVCYTFTILCLLSLIIHRLKYTSRTLNSSTTFGLNERNNSQESECLYNYAGLTVAEAMLVGVIFIWHCFFGNTYACNVMGFLSLTMLFLGRLQMSHSSIKPNSPRITDSKDPAFNYTGLRFQEAILVIIVYFGISLFGSSLLCIVTGVVSILLLALDKFQDSISFSFKGDLQPLLKFIVLLLCFVLFLA